MASRPIASIMLLLTGAIPLQAQDIDALGVGQRIHVTGYQLEENILVGKRIEIRESPDDDTLVATVFDVAEDADSFVLLGLTVQASADTRWHDGLSLDRLLGKHIKVTGNLDEAGRFRARGIELQAGGADGLVGSIDRVVRVASGAELMLLSVRVLVRLDVSVEHERPDTPRLPDVAPGDAPTYAALPFRNLTARDDAPTELLARLQTRLRPRGVRFVAPDVLEQSLRRHRIRYTDSLSVAAVQRIAGDTGARWLLLGSVLTWEPAPEPRIAVLLRVLDASSGERISSQLVTLSGKDFKGLLGLGAITEEAEMADEVVARLLASFDAEGAPRPPRPDVDELSDDRPDDAFTFYAAEDFDPRAVQRVAILPLGNRTRRGDAGLLFAEMLANQWFTSTGAVVIERSELVAALVRQDLRAIEALDLAMMRRIAGELDARYFVAGSIDRFGDETWVGGQPIQEMLATVWLLDVERGQVVAAAGLRRKGDDYHRGLGLGIVRDAMELADRTAHELVAAVGG
ncbi:MAG: DUF5666 domain-containing protein [Planctomycetota bacterium]|jgi:TolB-like protein